MSNELLQYLLQGSSNLSPNAKEIFLLHAEDEFNKGNMLNSIFYQVRALFQSFLDNYMEEAYWNTTHFKEAKIMSQMNDWEKEDFKSNPLMQYAVKTLAEKNKTKNEKCDCCPKSIGYNFLQNITDSVKGIEQIKKICAEFPTQWTILQICKGPLARTTYSIYPQIHESDACIYLTILRHVRSAKYPNPICIRLSSPKQKQLYRDMAVIPLEFKQHVNINGQTLDKEAKKRYWDVLGECNTKIIKVLEDFKEFLYPWCFLFRGKPFPSPNVEAYENKAFKSVDEFCNTYKWGSKERVILSLAALHVQSISQLELFAICNTLTDKEREQTKAASLLFELKVTSFKYKESIKDWKASNNYPCILVVDERLDHFFWEEISVGQEYTRVNNLQMLYTLFSSHKEKIKNGYLKVNITNGACVINPDSNLPNTEKRMSKFFQYWLPHWQMNIGNKPTQDQLLKQFFKQSCYVYAGHGSGLQYIHGKYIAKQHMNCVVFLFGCDSSRLHSNGLYSEMVGPHLYYHAAKCPTLVGTIMPALDSNMDTVASCLLSSWIAPKSWKDIIPWTSIEFPKWCKEGIIKPDTTNKNQSLLKNSYNKGSLCALIAKVHQRKTEVKHYNTVPYVCRGLPAWNVNVENLP
ncbi:uncharacterized protein LOC119672386 [Teleopsis dalmanni]|uniref:uncharacterized protein LOC119672386 n=1 Tax=Teleopsis dalmanni TaxID=139649 RepID=UPI0018CFD003|nr:uncharacterized protein LOC119672386 [Teleopsis dalmanni]